METLKRPSEIALGAHSIERDTLKKRRYYYEQLDHVEVYRHIIEMKQSKHKKHEQQERVKFALFLKYLMHHLCLTDQDKYKKAKQIVLDCTQLQREGKLEGLPLMSALKGRLFGLVGIEEYNSCEKNLDRYIENHGSTNKSFGNDI